LARRLGRR